MRKILLIILLSPVLSFAQQRTFGAYIDEVERKVDMLDALPRQRVSTNTALVLTDQWQTVGFVAGANPTLDVNRFPESRWDFTNQKILTNPNLNVEQGYSIRLDMALQNVTGMSKVQIRFVIPSPTPFYFPFPNSSTESYVDVTTLTIQGETKKNSFSFDLYTNSDFRTYGCQIQIRALSYSNTSNILTGLITQVLTTLSGGNRVQVLNSNLNIYSK